MTSCFSNMGSKKHLKSYPYHMSSMKLSEENVPCIPKIKWKCPPKFELRKEWCLAAGEESECRGDQNPWEMLNPVISAMPSSTRPSVSSNMEGGYYDNSLVPEIPIISIEEKESAAMAAATIQLDGPAQENSGTISQSPLPENLTTPQCNLHVTQEQATNEKSLVDLMRGLEDSDLVSAATAAAAVASILRSKEQGCSVDTSLLIEFLHDPKMTWKLIDQNEFGTNLKNGNGPEPTPNPPVERITTDHIETLVIPKPVSGKESIPPSIMKAESPSCTHSARGKAYAGIVPVYTAPRSVEQLVPRARLVQPSLSPEPVKQFIPVQSSHSGTSLTKNLINQPGSSDHTRTNNTAGINPVPSINHFTSITNVETIRGVKPAAPLVPSLRKPNKETKTLFNEQERHDNAGYGSFTGPMPNFFASATSKSHMVASPPANQMQVMGTVGRYALPSMDNSTPVVKDIDYYKSLIKQHGKINGDEGDKLSKIGQSHKHLQGPEFTRNMKPELDLNHGTPSVYYNTMYRHPMSQPPRPGRASETPFKRMKLG